ncbi:hypothetical protein THRCLA_22843 [Thraustotheca clavata]|uniref:Uncharacterized protein n=1 Tax=Thraustotheca clavata TaxID=74557 RepID=A0A1V9YS54_9STRA|nr:hypothetical protein THRCLA_22843 [Thraustotheca clavata]
MCHVKVVLLCKGRGGDVASYQPQRDETQWWNRRDALVRCVAAFLYGPWSEKCTSRELVLVHDEDWARMHMKLNENDTFPSEFYVINAWKEAALNPHAATRKNSSLECHLVHSSLPLQDAGDVDKMESKREVLEHLQKHCDIEFLRKHHLNSKPDVILRKTNKKKLVQVWDEWNQLHQASPVATTKEIVASIFTEMLQPKDDQVKQVIAATLHESSDAELPCFDLQNEQQDDSVQIVLFLGAVRDMLPSENKILERICNEQSIPLTGVRLGSVPEFTSKILSVVAYHQASGVLANALKTAIQNINQVNEPASKRQKIQDISTAQQHMHVVCSIPISSDQLTPILANRSCEMWTMVRLAVVTLWRSRIASSNATYLSTSLSFLFQDGKTLTLKQDELVNSLAEQHQAAPSEYQILNAFCKMLLTNKDQQDVSHLLNAPSLIALNVHLEDKDVDTLSTGIYNGTIDFKSQNILVLLSLTKKHPGHKTIVKACLKADIPLKECSILPSMNSFQDAAGATVTILQHFIYQNRLFCYFSTLANKKPTKKKKIKEMK